VYHRIAFFRYRFVDPDGGGQDPSVGHFALEPFWMFFIGSVKNCLSLFDNLLRTSIMDILGSQETDA